MNKPSIRVLIIGDSEEETELLLRLIKKGGYSVYHERIDTAQQMKEILNNNIWDIIISEYKMPNFTGIKALQILKEYNLDIPFILVSGIIDEETALKVMSNGANDYIIKNNLTNNLTRLVPAIEREIKACKNRADQKKDKDELKQSGEKYKELVENANSIIVKVDNDGRIILINEFGMKFFGYAKDELIGRSWNETILPKVESTGRVLENLASDIAKNIDKYGIHINENIKKNGERVWVYWAYKPILDENGNTTGILSVGTDFTDQKKDKDELKQSGEKFRSYIENAPDGIFITDEKGNYVDVNNAACIVTGYTREELLKMNLTDLMPYENRENPAKSFASVVERGKSSIETSFIKKGGEKRHWIVNNVKLSDGRFLGFTKDITERKEMEEKILNNAKNLEKTVINRTRQLEEANKELESFSYSVSHDLRAPLRSIDGFSKALLINYQDKLDDSGKDYLNRVRNASQKMGQLIDDMLKLSRTTRKELVNQDLDMTPIAEDITNELRINEPERIVKVSIEKGLKVRGDPDLIKVALTNLLSNSWKFTGKNEDARIEFGLIQDKDKKTYFIRDNGVGFDTKYADKLFQPFQRFHTQKEFTGSGIGLAIVFRVIKKHGGEIWAESEIGKGSTFYFRL